MKTIFLGLLVMGLTSLWGCSPQFWGGAAAGALGTGAGYEYNAHRQSEKLEDDYKSGRIGREEYLDRKRQIEKGSIIQ
ncbi:MAG TPA: hypothetical protein VE131_08500 [Terriglobales bacterium]|nr:hypothetical protein [Terriglobales bacterium]